MFCKEESKGSLSLSDMERNVLAMYLSVSRLENLLVSVLTWIRTKLGSGLAVFDPSSSVSPWTPRRSSSFFFSLPLIFSTIQPSHALGNYRVNTLLHVRFCRFRKFMARDFCPAMVNHRKFNFPLWRLNGRGTTANQARSSHPYIGLQGGMFL